LEFRRVLFRSSLAEVQRVMLDTGHLRLPVYEESLDRVIGIVLARDLWKAQRDGVESLATVIREPKFVPETKPVEDLIREMRAVRLKMAIVLDEYGGTAGLVTLEDLIAGHVGAIQDETQEEPPPFEEHVEGEVRISGGVPVWEVNERFGLDLPEEQHETVGGFVFGTLGRIAQVGDEVAVPQGIFRVLEMDGRRIDRLAFIRMPA